ncbi:MAG: hypothetical protein ACK4N5_18565, partial [Myxococcales bacterium]
RMVIVYDAHDSGTPARFRVRDDGDPVGSWQPVQQAFPEGIYHGAALSAVASPEGGMHLVYKAENDDLFYRYFDGVRFGPPLLLQDRNDWAVQPAITLRGDELIIFYSRAWTLNSNYDFRVQILRGGVLTPPVVLDDEREFKGYPAAAATLPTTVGVVPCFFGATPDDNQPGHAKLVRISRPVEPDGGGGSPDAGVPDGGTGEGDAGTGDADAGTPDAGVPPDGPSPIFTDDFERTSGPGPEWIVDRGDWLTDGRLVTGRSASSQVRIAPVQCADCRLEALAQLSGANGSLSLRAPAAAPWDGYELAVQRSGTLQLRRWRDGKMTVLAQLSGALTDPSRAVRLALEATGAGPVALTGYMDGVAVLSASDASSSAFKTAGFAGMWTDTAGVWFDAVRLYSTDAAPPPQPPPPPPSGTRLFFDDFSRSGTTALGPAWVIDSGSWIANGEAVTQRTESSQIRTASVRCLGCRVDLKVVPNGARVAPFLRAPPGRPGDGYDVEVAADGRIELRRWLNGRKSVL